MHALSVRQLVKVYANGVQALAGVERPGADVGKATVRPPGCRGQVEGAAVARGELGLLAVRVASARIRPDRVHHVAGGQCAAPGDHGIARGAAALAGDDGAALVEDSRATGTVDGPVDPAAAHEGPVGGVHDDVDRGRW